MIKDLSVQRGLLDQYQLNVNPPIACGEILRGFHYRSVKMLFFLPSYTRADLFVILFRLITKMDYSNFSQRDRSKHN